MPCCRNPLHILLLITLVITLGSVPSVGAGTASEGCMNQWLFNGIWRVEATKVEPYANPNGGPQIGWQVTEVWRNGTTQEVSPGDSILQDQKLELANGSMLATESSTGSMSIAEIGSHSFATAGQFTYTQKFVAANVDPSNKPKAIDIIFDGAKLATFKSRPQFTTHQYNFHVKLDCVASGAAAQAQGGSTQIAATEGCLNQWMSNGVWKMRATAIAPDNNNDPNSPQIGWMISQDWISQVSRPIAPADTLISDQYLITASGNNVPSSNSAGTSMNFSQLSYHSFAPGGSFNYQQRFRWGNLNPSDKPVRLLVTFDAAKQNVRQNAPHYRKPANFRINLECTK